MHTHIYTRTCLHAHVHAHTPTHTLLYDYDLACHCVSYRFPRVSRSELSCGTNPARKPSEQSATKCRSASARDVHACTALGSRTPMGRTFDNRKLSHFLCSGTGGGCGGGGRNWGGEEAVAAVGMQPWALSLPDKELCLREALAVCTPPAPEPSAKRPGS